jgi:hypothetical protein
MQPSEQSVAQQIRSSHSLVEHSSSTVHESPTSTHIGLQPLDPSQLLTQESMSVHSLSGSTLFRWVHWPGGPARQSSQGSPHSSLQQFPSVHQSLMHWLLWPSSQASPSEGSLGAQSPVVQPTTTSLLRQQK